MYASITHETQRLRGSDFSQGQSPRARDVLKKIEGSPECKETHGASAWLEAARDLIRRVDLYTAQGFFGEAEILNRRALLVLERTFGLPDQGN